MTWPPRPPDGSPPVGIAWRPELAGELLARPGLVDFVEVTAEACFVSRAARREAEALARIWPVVPHGVKLSLGSADGIDPARAARLGGLARAVGAPLVSEHVAFVRAGGQEIGHLTALPRTRAAVRAVARNVAAARRHLPDVPLLLENAACTVPWPPAPEPELEEGAFYEEIAEATGCAILLDVANLFANAINEGRDPAAALAAHPLERVALVHLAGGLLDDGFYADTHAHPTPAPVFELLAALRRRAGPVPALIERDGAFPPFAELEGELARARASGLPASSGDAGAPAAQAARSIPPRAEAGPARATAALAAAQVELARALVTTAPPDAAAVARWGDAALARTRGILLHKRIDDALPLLPALGRHGDRIVRLAHEALAGTPRAPARAAVADAARIAGRAARAGGFSPAAEADGLVLRARFTGAAVAAAAPRIAPRWTPFVGRATLPGGGAIWAFKGPGPHAPIRLSRGAPR